MHKRLPDETDRKILGHLSENGRISYRELGTVLGLSRTAIRKRISALEAAGIICGYYARIILPPEQEQYHRTDTEKTAAFKTYLVHFETEKSRTVQLLTALRQRQNVVWTAELAGKENLTAMIRAEDRQSLQALLQTFAAEIPGILRLRAQEILNAQTGAEHADEKERADEQRVADYRND